jgi:hypothetical protein
LPSPPSATAGIPADTVGVLVARLVGVSVDVVRLVHVAGHGRGRAVGVEREDGRHDEHAERDGCLGRHEFEHREREHPERDRRAEAEPIDVDHAAELRPRECDGEREGDTDAGGRRGLPHEDGVSGDDEVGAPQLDAGDEAEADDDRRSREILADACGRGLRRDGDDDQAGEPTERLHVEQALDRRSQRRLQRRDGDEHQSQEEDRGDDLARRFVHLREDHGHSGRPAEHQQAGLKDPERVGERSREDERGEDAVDEGKRHHRREQAGRLPDLPLDGEGDRVTRDAHLTSEAVTSGRTAIRAQARPGLPRDLGGVVAVGRFKCALHRCKESAAGRTARLTGTARRDGTLGVHVWNVPDWDIKRCVGRVRI